MILNYHHLPVSLLLKKGFTAKFTHVLYCPVIKISILFNVLGVWIIYSHVHEQNVYIIYVMLVDVHIIFYIK